MKFKCLSTKDNRKMDKRNLKYIYYYNDIKNEWYYEDEIIGFYNCKIITER